VLFLASFSSNDATLSQFYALIVLLESFIESLTVVLPFYPTATMERVVKEGTIATASTMARLFNTLPSCGRPTCLLVYDVHTLQNRFYLSGHTLAQLESTVPLLRQELAAAGVDAVAFPDDGAAKRFGDMFPEFRDRLVTCGKHRNGDRRVVIIQDGEETAAMAKHVVIVDDLVQSGGTLYECGEALKRAGAAKVSAFVAHAVFPGASWRRFAPGGDRAIFDRFWVSNSIPGTVDQLPRAAADGLGGGFQVLDIMPKIANDLP